jgi:hypothetical protein
LSAVPASITTWSAPVAQAPLWSSNGLNSGFASSWASPKVGAPPAPPITLPSRPTISDLLDASAAIVPAAASTPSRPRTFSSSDADTVAVPLPEPWTISLPEITASVWAYDDSNTPSNAFCIVSVRM